MTPTECLTKQLDIWQGALRSSTRCCQMGTITPAQYAKHKGNLDALITQYETAIAILKKNFVK